MLVADNDTPVPKYVDERGRIVAPSIERPGDMTPVSVKLPSIDALKDLTPAELLEVSQRYGVSEPWRALFRANEKYVAEFSRLTPGTADFAAEVARITEPMQSERAALGLARASMRNYNQLLATDGDETQILVRVGEGDDAMCEGCRALEGVEGTHAEHDAVGLPGSQECGQNCRCVLLPVETRSFADIGDVLLAGAAAYGIIDMILGGED